MISEDDGFPKMSGPGLYAFVSILSVILLSPSFFSHEKCPHPYLPTLYKKRKTLWSLDFLSETSALQESNDPLVHPIGNFTGVQDTLFSPNYSTDPSHRVRMTSLPKIILHFSFTQPWVNTGVKGSVELVMQVRAFVNWLTYLYI